MSNLIVISMTVTLTSPTLVTAIVFIINSVQYGLDVFAVYPALILLGMLRSLLYYLPQYQARYVSAQFDFLFFFFFFN